MKTDLYLSGQRWRYACTAEHDRDFKAAVNRDHEVYVESSPATPGPCDVEIGAQVWVRANAQLNAHFVAGGQIWS